MEDWDSTIQKQKEEKELELKQINMKTPKSGQGTMFPLETEYSEVCTPQLTNTLVGKTKEISEKEEQKDYSHDSDDFKFFEDDSDDTIPSSAPSVVAILKTTKTFYRLY